MADKKNWMDTLSETVDKATKAAAEAWDGTADVRKDAWEKTKAAASTASDALDEGVEKIKTAYKEGASDDPVEDAPMEAPADEGDAAAAPESTAPDDGTDEAAPDEAAPDEGDPDDADIVESP